MRTHKLLTLGLILAGALVVGLLGCSGDDKNPVVGENPTSEYFAVRSEVTRMVDSTIALVGDALETVQNARANDSNVVIDGDLLLTSIFDSDSVVTEGEWIVSYSVDLEAAGSNIVVDSVRFTKAGAYVTDVSSADALTLRHHWNFTNEQTTYSYSDYSVRANLTFSGLNTDIANVTGTATWYSQNKWIYSNRTEYHDITIDATLTNVTVDDQYTDWTSGCPAGGAINCTVDMAFHVDDNDDSITQWNLDMSFDGNVLAGAVSSAELDTTYVYSFCN
jgi:hypothetical protein